MFVVGAEGAEWLLYCCRHQGCHKYFLSGTDNSQPRPRRPVGLNVTWSCSWRDVILLCVIASTAAIFVYAAVYAVVIRVNSVVGAILQSIWQLLECVLQPTMQLTTAMFLPSSLLLQSLWFAYQFLSGSTAWSAPSCCCSGCI